MSVLEEASASSRRLPWVMERWFLPFWLAAVEWGWWRIYHAQFEAAPPASASVMPPIALAATLGAIGKLSGHVSEAAFYVLLWRARQVRLPFWRFLVVVVSASMADQLAYTIGQPFLSGGAPGWRVWLAGIHLIPDLFQDSPAMRAAFGSVGLLTASRIMVTAGLQAQATGRRFLEAAGWTTLVWFVTRLVAMWTIDLLRGLSPVGGG